MGMAKKRSGTALPPAAERPPGYDEVLAGISELLNRARHSTAQAINAILTAAYWEVGRRVVELEQRGQVRAAYGEGLLEAVGRRPHRPAWSWLLQVQHRPDAGFLPPMEHFPDTVGKICRPSQGFAVFRTS